MKGLLSIILFVTLVPAQQNETDNQFNKELQRAVDYYNVSLFEDSKRMLIDLLYSDAGRNHEAEIRYHLGVLSFYEGNVENALIQWKKLINEFPSYSRSKEISRLLGNYLSDKEGDELYREENFEYSQDLKQARLFWTPIYPNRKLFWGDLKDPEEAGKYYTRLIKKYDDPKKKFTFTYYKFLLLAGFNSDFYGYKNELGGKHEEVATKLAQLRQNAFKTSCVELLNQLEELVTDERDVNYSLLVQANYLWAIRLSGSKLFSGKVKINEESKPYFNKVIELTEGQPNNIYRTFSKHWLNKK